MNEDGGGAFASAKLRDYVLGQIKDNEDLYRHTGLVEPGTEASELLSFLEGIYDPAVEGLPVDVQETKAGSLLRRKAGTDRIGGHISDLPSYAVGLTDSEIEISQIQAYSKIATSILNEGAPYSSLIFGSMNRGKTGFAGLWLELWRDLVPMKYGVENGVVLTNMRTLEDADYVVTDVMQFKRLAFGDDEYIATGGEKGTPPEIPPDVPKWWHFDECSTHLDARTNRYEVTQQYLPLVKRFAKVDLDAVHLGHSGMDIHADMRRDNISTEFVFKTGLKTANVYHRMFEDSGADLKYVLEEIPETSIEYDPDDYSPWQWEDS